MLRLIDSQFSTIAKLGDLALDLGGVERREHHRRIRERHRRGLAAAGAGAPRQAEPGNRHAERIPHLLHERRARPAERTETCGRRVAAGIAARPWIFSVATRADTTARFSANIPPMADPGATLLARLAAAVGHAHVLTAPADVEPYLVDWRGRYRGAALAVVRPGITERSRRRSCAPAPKPACRSFRKAATPACAAARRRRRRRAQIVLSLARMNRVRALDAANATMTVEAGVHARRGAEPRPRSAGMLFPLSLASEGSCTIGGNLSTNAGGTAVLRFGNARDLALGLEVVLRRWPDLGRTARPAQGQHRLRPEAAVHRRRRNARHRHGGRAEALPGAARARDGAGGGARRRRRRSRCSDAAASSALGDRLTGFELMSGVLARAVAQAPSGARRIRCPGTRGTCWCRSTTARRTRGCRRSSSARSPTALEAGIVAGCDDRAVGRAGARAVGAAREHLAKRSGARAPTSSTTSRCRSPRSRASCDDARAALARGAARRARSSTFGHLGDGNLHYNLAAPEGDRRRALHGRTRRAPIASSTTSSPRHGGSISAEHGIGQLKRDELVRYKSAGRARADARGSRPRSTRRAS